MEVPARQGRQPSEGKYIERKVVSMALKNKNKKHGTKFKKAASKKAAAPGKVANKRMPRKKIEKATQAKIEMEFLGSTEELGKLLFDLFQAHELETGYSKEITPDAKIELLPMRISKGADTSGSAVVLLTINLDVPETIASKYLWHKIEKFTASKTVKVLVNRTEYVYNERELKNIIKTAIEHETDQELLTRMN